MAFNGAGTFLRLYNWVQDRNNGIKILASRMDAEMDGFATGLSTCITTDGQSTPTASIPMASQKITLLASGAARTDAANVGQLQDAGTQYSSASGTNNYVAGMTPTLSAIVDGFSAAIYFPNANTTAATATLNLDGIGARNLVRDTGAIVRPNEIQPGVGRVVAKGSVFYYYPALKGAFNLSNLGTIATGATAPLNAFFMVDCTSTSQTMPTDGGAAIGDVMMFAKFGTNNLTETLTNSQKFNGSTISKVTSSEGVSTQVYTGASRGWVEG